MVFLRFSYGFPIETSIFHGENLPPTPVTPPGQRRRRRRGRRSADGSGGAVGRGGCHGGGSGGEHHTGDLGEDEGLYPRFIWLVVWNMFFSIIFSWEFHHPN